MFSADIHLWEQTLSNWFGAQKLELVVSSKNRKVRKHLLPCHLVSGDPKKDFVIVRELELKVHDCFLHFFYFSVSLGNEEKVSSPTPVFVFIISLVGLWWVLEADAWKWSSRSFHDPCSRTRKGPGGPSNA